MPERKKPRPPEWLLRIARRLRRDSQPAEQLLWHFLRAHRFGGYKFRRQHPIEPYVLDFYCDAAKLAIELDGSQHAEDSERDELRERFLEVHGIRVLRFWNKQLLENRGDVLAAIWDALNERAPSPSPGAPLRGAPPSP